MESFAGKCHCGDVQLKVQGPKKYEFLCHCGDCKRMNSGGHLAGIVFEKVGLETNGKVAQYSYSGGSGKEITLTFCPRCATQLFAALEVRPEVVIVRANVLSDEGAFQPKKSLFPEEAFPWDRSVISE